MTEPITRTYTTNTGGMFKVNTDDISPAALAKLDEQAAAGGLGNGQLVDIVKPFGKVFFPLNDAALVQPGGDVADLPFDPMKTDLLSILLERKRQDQQIALTMREAALHEKREELKRKIEEREEKKDAAKERFEAAKISCGVGVAGAVAGGVGGAASIKQLRGAAKAGKLNDDAGKQIEWEQTTQKAGSKQHKSDIADLQVRADRTRQSKAALEASHGAKSAEIRRLEAERTEMVKSPANRYRRRSSEVEAQDNKIAFAKQDRVVIEKHIELKATQSAKLDARAQQKADAYANRTEASNAEIARQEKIARKAASDADTGTTWARSIAPMANAVEGLFRSSAQGGAGAATLEAELTDADAQFIAAQAQQNSMSKDLAEQGVSAMMSAISDSAQAITSITSADRDAGSKFAHV